MIFKKKNFCEKFFFHCGPRVCGWRRIGYRRGGVYPLYWKGVCPESTRDQQLAWRQTYYEEEQAY